MIRIIRDTVLIIGVIAVNTSVLLGADTKLQPVDNLADSVVVAPRDTILNADDWFKKNGGVTTTTSSPSKESVKTNEPEIDKLSDEWFKDNSSKSSTKTNKGLHEISDDLGGVYGDLNVAVNDFKISFMDMNGFLMKKSSKEEFEARWSLIDIGLNTLNNTSYGMYPVSNDFMDIDNNKSIEFAINFCKLSIGLSRFNPRIGLMTGLGITWNNYRFNQPYTIKDENGMVQPLALDDDGLIKSKLVSSYLSIPLMFQYKLRIPNSMTPIVFSAGVTGEIKLGSHTKIKTSSGKQKDHDDFQLVPFRYSYTGRISYGLISVYFKYYQPNLFQSDKGPQTTPMTFGIGLF
ncbi:PorT family protein [Halosquirtibacter xylanolyticus]|uniref:outer membrane beta-barrel protein n=1 Tax=Halosquirtibacter xylanolyticus TaxID=3374599 RepID=UPI003749944C|nr:PorT family protein [Prolixibacteraceae bacterium]